MNMDYFSFCPRLREMLETGNFTDAEGKRIPIKGTSTPNNLRIIRELILENRCKRTIEVGLAYGASALTILATLRRISPDGFQHTAIDPYQRGVFGGTGLTVIREEGFGGNFRFHEDFSSTILPKLLAEEESFDLAYIDGSHLFEEVFIDTYYLAHMVRVGGILLFDDCMDPHVAKVIRFLRRNYESVLEPYSLNAHDDPEKSLRKKAGNLLGVRQLKGFRKIADPPRPWDAPFRRF